MNKETVFMQTMIFKETLKIFHMFSYKSLASGAFFLEMIVIADNKPMIFCYRCYKNTFFIYFLIRIILKYIEIQI